MKCPRNSLQPLPNENEWSIVIDIQRQETSDAQMCDSCPRRSSNHSVFRKPSSRVELFTPVGIKNLQLNYFSSVKINFQNRFLKTRYILFAQQNKQICLAFQTKLCFPFQNRWPFVKVMSIFSKILAWQEPVFCRTKHVHTWLTYW